MVYGVIASGAAERVTICTGNDDHIVLDLVTPFRTGPEKAHFAGGLLGHWSVWTFKAVNLLGRCRAARRFETIPKVLRALDGAVTNWNAALFDVRGAGRNASIGPKAKQTRTDIRTVKVAIPAIATQSRQSSFGAC